MEYCLLSYGWGSTEELHEILLGQGPQSSLGFTEYTSNVNSADAASRRHFLVVIKCT